MTEFNNDPELLKSAKNAAAMLIAIYQHLDRVESAGGAQSISGVAACDAFLKSMRKNEPRAEELVLFPLREAIARAEKVPV